MCLPAPVFAMPWGRESSNIPVQSRHISLAEAVRKSPLPPLPNGAIMEKKRGGGSMGELLEEAARQALHDRSTAGRAEEAGWQAGFQAGREVGIRAMVRVLAENSLDREEAARRLARNFDLTAEEAAERAERYWP